MSKKISNETTVVRVGDMIRITRTMVEDLTPDEYIENLNALITKVNRYAHDLKHDTAMRDTWIEGRVLALKVRDELMLKQGTDKDKVPERQNAEVTGGFDTFQKDQLKNKVKDLKNHRGGKKNE